MLKKRPCFIGLLANTNASILKLHLGDGFTIQSMSDDEGYKFFSILENLPAYETGKKLFIDYHCLNAEERKLYFVTNCLEIDVEEGGADSLEWKISVKIDNLVENYLEPKIRLMRLFKEGNIHMPMKYYFFIENDMPKPFMSKGSGLFTHIRPMSSEYTVEESEVPSLEKFIQDTKLPFHSEFLQLAFENFELSYQVPITNLSFLALMNSLEALFNRGQAELNYTISRSVAVLLGKDMNESKIIFKKMKELYDIRSDIVHARKLKGASERELLNLRHYVRESIKEISYMNKNKEEVFDLLNSHGFGNRTWHK
jgi:hypothetical protein